MSAPTPSPDDLLFVAGIDFHGEGLATFDPEKVGVRAQTWFGADLQIDPTDHAATEIAQVESFLAAKKDADPKEADTMRREVTLRARRNGPVYQFACTPPDALPWMGVLSRYSITCFLPKGSPEHEQRRVLDFLRSLELGRVYAVQDGQEISLP